MNDSSLMPFGKFKGVKMIDVPAEHLLYIYENYKLYGEVKAYIEENLDVIKEQIKRNQK
jgi:uncharacterized protein (DUF3820 family)